MNWTLIGSVLEYALFAAAGVFALTVLIVSIVPARGRIMDALFPASVQRERWRRVHLAADRRRPFAAAPARVRRP